MHRPIRLLALLTSSSLFCIACDSQSDDFEPDTSFRSGKNNCATVRIGTQQGVFKISGTDNPEEPDGGGDPWPLHRDLEMSLISRNFDSVAEATFAHSAEGRSACRSLCTEYGLRWRGEACVIDGGVDFGEARAIEFEDGLRGYEVDVYGEVDLSCVCPGLDDRW